MSRGGTFGKQVFLDGAPVDPQLPLNCSKRHPLASGSLNRLPSLHLPSISPSVGTSACAAEAAAAGTAAAALLAMATGSLSSSALESSAARVAIQRWPKPSAPEGGTGTLAEPPWLFRSNTGLGGASWEATMRPSWSTVSRPSSPTRTSTTQDLNHPGPQPPRTSTTQDLNHSPA